MQELHGVVRGRLQQADKAKLILKNILFAFKEEAKTTKEKLLLQNAADLQVDLCDAKDLIEELKAITSRIWRPR